ncbi:hypothetical protein PEC301899_01390 [Pectobacterium carotovorum subsp. carotovorum]|nr:hypothetical protein C9I36_13645 [Pectobacterium punjabense]GKW09857.1 hypothetical protein PEC301899_01390 [Pectobacterium carotovorum subsp. carotovorum]
MILFFCDYSYFLILLSFLENMSFFAAIIACGAINLGRDHFIAFFSFSPQILILMIITAVIFIIQDTFPSAGSALFYISMV